MQQKSGGHCNFKMVAGCIFEEQNLKYQVLRYIQNEHICSKSNRLQNYFKLFF